MPSEDTFNTAYWASKNPRIVATYQSHLRSTKFDREAAFQALAHELHNERLEGQGDLIDQQIMVEQKSPYTMMVEIRKAGGYTWVPNYLQKNIGAIPGITVPNVPPLPGQVAYDPKKPPVGSILVVTDESEYKPYAAAPTPTAAKKTLKPD